MSRYDDQIAFIEDWPKVMRWRGPDNLADLLKDLCVADKSRADQKAKLVHLKKMPAYNPVPAALAEEIDAFLAESDDGKWPYPNTLAELWKVWRPMRGDSSKSGHKLRLRCLMATPVYKLVPPALAKEIDAFLESSPRWDL